MKAIIGIIGGSGLYQLPGLESVKEVSVHTGFGDPSDALISGTLQGTQVFFLPRHGRGHKILPSEVNYRANIAALKHVGCTHILSVSAVGSMKEHMKPGDFVLVDQFIDWTKGRRASSFFGEGVVGHVSLAEPICKSTMEVVYEATKDLDFKIHKGGTYICIEGPQFSTKAESLMFRSFGVSVIGMTNVPECKLAREAGMSYVTAAMVTDFDCWHPDHDAVTLDDVIKTFQGNVQKAKEMILRAIPAISQKAKFPYRESRAGAIMTSSDARPQVVMNRLEPIIEA